MIREYYHFLPFLLMIVEKGAEVGANLVLAPSVPYDRDFNFHNKSTFLKDHIKKLINCIQPEPNNTDPSYMPLPFSQTLKKSSKLSADGKERFVFDYNGTREYNETCLGDSYKKDFIRRLYDAICMTYDEKIKFLNALSCNSTQILECRQVGVEPFRQFAEQATPIMRCLCPDYSKSQAFFPDALNGYFHYSNKRKECVLKTGQKCTINPKALDVRLEWNDFDYDGDLDGNPEGIDVIDLRSMATTYPCVDNAFCYTEDKKGLEIEELHRERCVCEAGYFSGTDRECHRGRDPPTMKGTILAIIMFSIGFGSFVAVLLL